MASTKRVRTTMRTAGLISRASATPRRSSAGEAMAKTMTRALCSRTCSSTACCVPSPNTTVMPSSRARTTSSGFCSTTTQEMPAACSTRAR